MKTIQEKRIAEISNICTAFNLGKFMSSHVMDEIKANNMVFQLTEFKTTKGTFKHYFRIK